MCALILFWIVCSLIGLVPSALEPWALSAKTIWVDKLCINQATDQTKAEGVAGFKRFLGQCDKMVAFVGPSCVCAA